MKTFKEYQPTCFDCKGLGSDGQENWLVLPVIQTRDSDCLEQSNFAEALKRLGGESDHVEVHRFGHWGPGWFEIIVISPAYLPILTIAEDIESSLENYPVLNDNDLSEREIEAQTEYWNSWLRRHEFLPKIETKFGIEYPLFDPTDEELDSLRQSLEELSGNYIEGSGNHMYIPMEKWLDYCDWETLTECCYIDEDKAYAASQQAAIARCRCQTLAEATAKDYHFTFAQKFFEQSGLIRALEELEKIGLETE